MEEQNKTTPPQDGPGGAGSGYITTGFPAPGLRRTVRHITGYDDQGKSVFLGTDCGDHHRIIGDQQALANIIWSTRETPVDINGNVDIKHAKENEVSLYLSIY
jgi:hypothetical protein